MTVEAIRTPLLGDIPHGFLGRRGGVSAGIHGGLNVGLGSEDDTDAVAENHGDSFCLTHAESVNERIRFRREGQFRS